jgi:hypothetical protein
VTDSNHVQFLIKKLRWFWWGSQKERDHYIEKVVDRRTTILKLIFKKRMGGRVQDSSGSG